MKTLTNLATKKTTIEAILLILGLILVALTAYEIVIVGQMAQ